jgi:Domain of unknown function (DUF4279)
VTLGMKTTISTRRLEIQLMVDHPCLTSNQLTKLLNLAADEQWDVGKSYKPSTNSDAQYYTFTRWALRSVANSLDEAPEALQSLIQRIREIEQKFCLLPSDSTVSLTFFVTESATVIGMGIDNDVIKLLARINAGIEVSLVVNNCDC